MLRARGGTYWLLNLFLAGQVFHAQKRKAECVQSKPRHFARHKIAPDERFSTISDSKLTQLLTHAALTFHQTAETDE